jgi:hypothetical protein
MTNRNRSRREIGFNPSATGVRKSLLLLWRGPTISATDPSIARELEDLPKVSGAAVATFVAAARQVFRDDLRSVILYGSCAEGRLRPTSDIKLVLVL